MRGGAARHAQAGGAPWWWLIWTGAAHQADEGRLQAAQITQVRLWRSLSPQQIAMGPAVGRVLQWLGALLLCAEPFVMLCQVLQLVLLQREPATSLGPPCQAVPCWVLPRRP